RADSNPSTAARCKRASVQASSTPASRPCSHRGKTGMPETSSCSLPHTQEQTKTRVCFHFTDYVSKLLGEVEVAPEQRRHSSDRRAVPVPRTHDPQYHPVTRHPVSGN